MKLKKPEAQCKKTQSGLHLTDRYYPAELEQWVDHKSHQR
uniref:Uncharacterized protein n=1 Tax=Tetranychus urticae TaxID=32264 RepID=T1JR09_TETUR